MVETESDMDSLDLPDQDIGESLTDFFLDSDVREFFKGEKLLLVAHDGNRPGTNNVSFKKNRFIFTVESGDSEKYNPFVVFEVSLADEEGSKYIFRHSKFQKNEHFNNNLEHLLRKLKEEGLLAQAVMRSKSMEKYLLQMPDQVDKVIQILIPQGAFNLIVNEPAAGGKKDQASQGNLGKARQMLKQAIKAVESIKKASEGGMQNEKDELSYFTEIVLGEFSNYKAKLPGKISDLLQDELRSLFYQSLKERAEELQAKIGPVSNEMVNS